MWQKIKTLITGKETKESTGRIKFFNRRRGYGFIESDNLEKDVFVHVTDLKDRVSKGDEVTFHVEPSPKGLEAKNVRLSQA